MVSSKLKQTLPWVFDDIDTNILRVFVHLLFIV